MLSQPNWGFSRTFHFAPGIPSRRCEKKVATPLERPREKKTFFSGGNFRAPPFLGKRHCVDAKPSCKSARRYCVHAKDTYKSARRHCVHAKALTNLQEGIASTQKALTNLQEDIASMQKALTSQQEGIASAQRVFTNLHERFASTQWHIPIFITFVITIYDFAL